VSTDASETWVIILAAGDGRRLRDLTTDRHGTPVPKQFCTLRGGPTLLEETLARALQITASDRIVAIVADEHAGWWRPLLGSLPGKNIIRQPRNRGTGNGILLPLLHVLDRDPSARIVLLPSDHYVGVESVLLAGIRSALGQLERWPDDLLLLGIAPDEADPELGYIEPGPPLGADVHAVARFVEKPSSDVAQSLVAVGGVWNSFIVATHGQALLDLYASRYAEVVLAMVAAREAVRGGDRAPLERLYGVLPEIDFSRHVITGAERRLRLVRVGACGWNDLGTPQRVGRTLARVPMPRSKLAAPPTVNLAAAWQRMTVTEARAIA